MQIRALDNEVWFACAGSSSSSAPTGKQGGVSGFKPCALSLEQKNDVKKQNIRKFYSLLRDNNTK